MLIINDLHFTGTINMDGMSAWYWQWWPKHCFMKNALLSIALVLMMVSPAAAQEKPEFDPDDAWNTIRAEYGALVPVGPYPNKSFGLVSLSYSRRYSGRWGWRTGMQYARLDAPVEKYVGLPLSAVYRFSTSPFDGRLRRAIDKSLDDLSWNDGGDPPEHEKRRMSDSVVADIFNVFLRRTEFFAGLTPGLLTGLEPNHRFSLAADAGITLSIPLGRFSLDITPATYYLFTKNCGEHRWLFSVSGGLSILF